VLKQEGFYQSVIARSLGRDPSTINRKLARNSNAQGYRGGLAIKRTVNVDLEVKKEIKLDSAMSRMFIAWWESI